MRVSKRRNVCVMGTKLTHLRHVVGAGRFLRFPRCTRKSNTQSFPPSMSGRAHRQPESSALRPASSPRKTSPARRGQPCRTFCRAKSASRPWSTSGGKNGAGTSVDLRGFGATASSNTLVLLNGRRLNDIDLSGVDLSAIPRDSIERIEITRGNSGAVLYGDGAVGGVINIITKTGTGSPPTARVEARLRLVQSARTQRLGRGIARSVRGVGLRNGVDSDGYRVNTTCASATRSATCATPATRAAPGSILRG